MKTAKKVFSVFMAIALAFTTLCITASAASLRRLDLAFVIDTTGSMYDDIYRVKSDMINYLEDLNESGMDYRIAVVDYRDFESRTYCSDDYEYKVQCDFTNDYDTILSVIDGLTLGDGGDFEETIYSALIDGLNELTWRKEAGKAAILMGDAPALDPEPFTGYTLEMAVNSLKTGETALKEELLVADTVLASLSVNQNSSERSSVTLFTIATSSDAESNFEKLASSTGGKSYSSGDSDEISGIITEIIETIPDVVEEPDIELSFFDKVKNFLLNLFYIISFQFEKIDWNLCF